MSISGLAVANDKIQIANTVDQAQAVVSYQQPITVNKAYSSAFTKAKVTEVANQVADWQLSQFDIRSNMMRAEKRASGIPEGWMYATFDIGLLAWANQSDQHSYNQAVINFSLLNQWKLGPRVYHADDHAIGDVYLDLYTQYGGKEKIAHLVNSFNQVLARPSQHDLEFNDHDKVKQIAKGRVFYDPSCTARWCWADAIFMAPPVWAKLSKVTGNNAYVNFMNNEFWQTTQYLFKPKEQLFLRDSRYFSRHDVHGNLIYWGRGNGWVLAGIARILENMPANFDKREKYIALYKAMSARLIALQQADGSWPSSLLEAEQKSTPESSGTGLLIYALAWGINHGVLDKTNTLPAVKKGWQSLVNSVAENGKLGWVQQVAFAPGSATKNDTQLYGTGAFLLAASQVLQLSKTMAE